MQADPEALRLERPRAPVDVGRRQAHVVARIGLRQLGHQQAGVRDGARHRADSATEVRRIDRHPAEAGLEREDAVPRGRQPHRAADVGAEMQRPVARRRRGARTGAGAAGIPGEVPRVARQRMERGAARRQHAVVRHGGLGEDHRARLAHPRGGRRIGGRRHEIGGRGAERNGHALGGDVLLDGDGHAVEGAHRLALLPARLRFLRRLAGGAEIRRIERLEPGLPLFDVGDDGVGRLDRREFLRLVGGEQLDGAHIGDVCHALTLDPPRPASHFSRSSAPVSRTGEAAEGDQFAGHGFSLHPLT